VDIRNLRKRINICDSSKKSEDAGKTLSVKSGPDQDSSAPRKVFILKGGVPENKEKLENSPHPKRAVHKMTPEAQQKNLGLVQKGGK